MAVESDLRHDLEQFEALQKAGLLDSLYESLQAKQRAVAHYQSLSPVIRGRVRALKRIQLEILKLEAEFHKECSKIEQRFDAKYQKLFEKRKSIIAGTYEPTLEETSWNIDDEDVDTSTIKISNEGDQPRSSAQDSFKESQKGVPGFWLTVLKHAPLLRDLIQPTDTSALKHLLDVRCTSIESNGQSGFQLEFEFEPNEHFSNTILTKRYFLSYDVTERDPLMYEGPEIVSSEGCTINWLPNKDLTADSHSSVQHKIPEEKQTLRKIVNSKSFFKFFNPPKSSNTKGVNIPVDKELLDDFDLGQYLKDRVIPRAVSYFTGESPDLESDEDDPDDFPEDDYKDESDEELDEEEDP